MYYIDCTAKNETFLDGHVRITYIERDEVALKHSNLPTTCKHIVLPC